MVLAVSRLAREKRIDVLIEAVRRARHAARIQLVICGAGPEEARLRRAAATLPNPAEFRVVEVDDVPDVLRAADLLVHASEIELEGMAVLEALGTGLPTLVADAPFSAAARLAIGDEFRFPPGDAARAGRPHRRARRAPGAAGGGAARRALDGRRGAPALGLDREAGGHLPARGPAAAPVSPVAAAARALAAGRLPARPLAAHDPERAGQRREVGQHRQQEGGRGDDAELAQRREAGEAPARGSRRR